MREFTVIKWRGKYRIGWQSEDKPPQTFIDVPDELIGAVESIATHIDNQKTPEETALDTARQYIASLPDGEKLALVDVFPKWMPGKDVAAGYEYKHLGNLYRCLQTHKTQADWEPQNAPALWFRIEALGVVPEFVPPTGAHDAYSKGDRVLFDGKKYESVIDSNVWSPVEYPAGWRLVP